MDRRQRDLHLYGWRLADVPCPERLLAAAAVAESLGRLVGRMHAAGVAHRDLKWANLLVVSGEWPQTFLVDVDGLVLGRRVSVRRQAADLAHLAVGLTAHPWITAGICRRFFRRCGPISARSNGEECAMAKRGRATATRARQSAAADKRCCEGRNVILGACDFLRVGRVGASPTMIVDAIGELVPTRPTLRPPSKPKESQTLGEAKDLGGMRVGTDPSLR